MNPIYKFQLSANGATQQAFPNRKDDLAIDYALEQNQEFYRGKLSGKLTFQKDDYLFIRSKAFDTQFDIVIYISYNAGQTWTVYWSGQFWKTNCQFDEDNQTAIVTPTVNDRYNAVLAGMEKEYNLIDLVPVIEPVKLDKRPMIQVYVPGQTVIGCFLSGMWWEQECESVLETDTVEIEDQTYPALEYKYHFSFNKAQRQINVTQTGTPTIPTLFYGTMPETVTTNYEYTSGGYKFRYTFSVPGQYAQLDWEIIRVSDGVTLWSYRYTGQNPPMNYPMTVILQPVSGTGATGTVELFIHDVKVYSRYITDVEQALGLNTYPLPDDDLVENNRNYHYAIGYYFPETIWFSDYLTSTPTKWGIYQPGLYYDDGIPPSFGVGEAFPITRAAWGRTSLWFVFFVFDSIAESYWRKEYTLKDAYPIWSVISVLLAKIAPGITHAGTTDYSRFLYDTNPISYIDQRLFITPKSNLISSGYDQPAQKAPITLKRVMDMLRDCFRCYWFVDEQNRFRIEHISYFMRGGTYTGQPVVGMDLTKQIVTRNGKAWAYARNQYEFDKPEMAARYQFGWMDDVTELFDGYPIDIISKYVNPDNIEQIDVSQFTSDVDYILLNPGAVSKDGFVLLAAALTNGEYKLPYVNFTINFSDYILQNAWVAFIFLQQYYMFDMPARNVQINGVTQMVRGIKKLKTQTIKFPVLTEPDMFNLIKTGLGNGTIQKLSVNLSSRNANATLKYDTE